MTAQPQTLREPENPPEVSDAVADRIVPAALRVLGSYGLTKLTLDDVAKEAGCSRATLYRYFPGKAALLLAVVDGEAARLRSGLDEALAGVASLGEALEAAAGYGARSFAGHDALQFLLAHEPGAVLPHLCFQSGSRLLEVLSAAVAPHLCRFLPPLEARRTGEWLARIVLSYGCTPPSGAPSAGGEGAVISLVRDFVLPALDAEDPDA
jgi:AcrR family transcriptional regulator